MKRHPVLQDLSRDHHVFLLHCRQIRWFLQKDPRQKRSLLQIVEEFLSCFHEEFLFHIEEEENILLSQYEKYPSRVQLEQSKKLKEDHAFLQSQVAKLQENLQKEETLILILEKIEPCLYKHIRFEERELFASIQVVFSPKDFDDLEILLRNFRLQTRGKKAMGPRDECATETL